MSMWKSVGKLPYMACWRDAGKNIQLMCFPGDISTCVESMGNILCPIGYDWYIMSSKESAMTNMQESFAKALIEMLDEKPLSEITVKDIAGRCAVSRQSF